MSELALMDRQREQWALLWHKGGKQRTSLAMFVHGFRGDYLSTWGSIPEMLRTEATKDKVLAQWDYCFLGYKTRAVKTYLDIAKLIETQWSNASSGRPPFPHAYARLALFGHSLGTLGIRQLLCAKELHPDGFIEALHRVILLGTPLNGSWLAEWSSAKVFGGEIAEALKPGNVQLRMLHSWNKSARKTYAWKDVRVVLGSEDLVVGNKYSDLITFAGDEPQAKLYNLGHSDLVKPDPSGESSAIYDEIKGALG